MTNISDLIKSNYQEFNDYRVIDVAEWKLKIYVGPLTVGQMQEINTAQNQFDLCLKTIEVRAKNEHGQRIFKPHDMDEIKSKGVGIFGPDKLIEIASLINEDINEVNDAAKKND